MKQISLVSRSIFSLLLLLVTYILQAQTIYITPLGAGDQSGSSWGNAAPGDRLQAKINAAPSGSQVWVAEGTYYPNTYPEGCTSCSVPRNYTFQLRNGVSIYGGFAGSETATGQRNIQQHSSILSGDIGTAGDDADNVYHVVLSINNNAMARLDGFTITKGNADGNYTGGSIYVNNHGVQFQQGAGYYGYQSSPAIANCTFTANAARYHGAGMYNYYKSSPVITDCNFTANTSTYGKGAGLANEHTCSLVVKRSSFQNNSAFDAGGVYNDIYSSLAFTDCLFSGNTATASGSSGGGVYNSYLSPVTFTNCSFTGNKASRGGGLYNINSTAIITNCVFAANVNNYAGSGAGIENTSGSSLTITGCSFLNNRGGNYGGAIYNFGSSLSSVNCAFAGNSALFAGGAIYTSSYTSNPVSSNISNCTFYGNSATEFYGGFVGGGAILSGNYTDLSVSNSIIWGNTGKVPGIYSINTPVVSFSNVQDGSNGQGNINADPLFVDASDPDGADDIFGTEDDGLTLNDHSPAINGGDNDAIAGTTTDITGNSRILNSAVDMGAYESPYDAPLTPWVSITANPGVKVCAGTTVTFTARPVNGGASPAYQWKKNGDVVGTSNATYSTSDLADGDVILVQLTSSESNVSLTTATDSLKVMVNEVPDKPVVTANGTTTFCDGSDVILSAPDGYSSYKWSNGETTQSITIAQSGSYSVMVSNASGCTSSSSDAVNITVNSIPAAPVVTVSDNCGSSSLSTTATGSLLWSTGATTSSINVSNAGNYTVTQTVNGCVSEAGSVTAAPKTAPSVPTVMVTNNCGSSILSTTATGSLLWSTGATTSSIMVSDAGDYSVTQTVNGCTSDAGSATAAPKAIPSAQIVIVTNNCGTSTLSTTATGSLLWSTGETTPSITVRDAGNYSVTQTVNGCLSEAGSATAAPKAIPTPPVVTVTNNCGSSTLSTTATGSLLWSTGATTSSITVSNTGNYTVTQTVNGCVSEAGAGTAAAGTAAATPVITTVNSCGNSTLSIPAGGTILWSTGATTPSITVTNAGMYKVTRTINGCTSAQGSATASPKALPLIPTVTVLNTCGISILSTQCTGGLLWNTGATTPSIIVTAAGTYTVTQTVNGCTSLPGSGIAAPKKLPATPVITVTNNCGSSVLSTTATGSLLWSTGAKTPSITVSNAGTYSVIQTVNGCPSLPGSGTAAPNKVPSITANSITANTAVTNCSASVAFGLNVTVTGTPAPTLVYKVGNTVITSPYTFPVGATTVSVIATNSCGNVTKTFVVTVKDNQSPSVICKPGATKTISGSTYTVSGTEFNATASDNCGTHSLIYTLTGATSVAYKSTNTSLAGVKLNVGTTTITWKATDASGNISTCNTVVKVTKSGLYRPVEVTSDAKLAIAKLSVKVAPNPSSYYFTLQFKSGSNEKCELVITDVAGRPIEQRSNIATNSTLQIGSSYRPGTYIATILQGNEKISIKLIKN